MWYKLKRIMMRPNGVEKQVRPSGWQPWANTVLYVPMQTDLLDHWPNYISLTNTNVQIATIGWVPAWYFPTANNPYNLRWNITSYISSEPFTISVWVYTLAYPTWSSSDPRTAICWMLGAWPYKWTALELLPWGFRAEFLGGTNVTSSSVPTLNKWYLITVTRDSNNSNKLYVNSQLVWSSSSGWNDYFGNFVIGTDWTDSGGLLRHWKWYMREFIMEKTARTVQEIADYYNLTKWDYWL